MGWIDWTIIAAFFTVLIVIGMWLSGKADDADGFFLSHRDMPWWAASASVAATALSAGTFVGVPQVSYTGDLTWMMLLIGSTLGGLIAAFLIIPVLYRSGTLTIYGYLRNRFGPRAEIAASWFFMIGTLLAAGTRHFIASIVVSLMVFGSIDTWPLILSIVILGAVATLYTVCGGIRAVIWTDVLQVLILAGAAVFCVYLLFTQIPLDLSGILDALREAPTGNKLRFWNPEFRFDMPYTVWAAVGAYALLNVAQYGCCQDSVQRMMTCKSAWGATLSLVVSRLIQVPIVLLFLAIGALLYIFYQCPEVMGAAAPAVVPEGTREIFPFYILKQLPAGALGLALCGMLAASMSSFDSAVNALASIIHGNLRKKDLPTELSESERKKKELGNSRSYVLLMGAALTFFAVMAVFLQEAGGQRLIDFALSVLTFSYAGLFGVFMTAVLTRQGNERSAVRALWTGALVVLMVQPWCLPHWSNLLFGVPFKLAWPWWMVVGGGASFLVCVLGRKYDRT
ncbi:MAG: sodium:solute symporter [Kiritimatiellae bacterium]|jgi:SSS family solute:Na+ symporter|nr:sodium:solute symporter [Kiritimatiellia bacterium]